MSPEHRAGVEAKLARRARSRAFGPGPHVLGLHLSAHTRERGPLPRAYPFLPAVHQLTKLRLDQPVTILCGENGAGKSTLIEALAVLSGFPIAGGRLVAEEAVLRATRAERALVDHLGIEPGACRPREGFFLRGESFFNVAAEIDRRDLSEIYGGDPLREQSHGESFLALAANRFGADSLFILDEPESALSVSSQLAFIALMQRAVAQGSQFILATHSSILLLYPAATIYEISDRGIETVDADDTDPVRLTRGFLAAPDRFLRELGDED